MKKTLKRLTAVVLSVIMCASLMTPAFAAFDYVSLINAIIGGGSTEDINLIEILTGAIENEIHEESLIDKIINNIKNGGSVSENEPEEEVVVDAVGLDYAVKLFNLTVNRIKKEKPSMTRNDAFGLDAGAAKNLGTEWFSLVSGIMSAMIMDKSIVAEAIKSTSTEYTAAQKIKKGVDHDDFMPLTGTPDVSQLTVDMVKNYQMTVYRSGAYAIRLDFPTVVGSAKGTAYDAVYDVPEAEGFSFNLLGTGSLATNIKFKYLNGFVEVNVNKKGDVSAYRIHLECTADAASNTILSMAFDPEAEGLVYVMDTSFSGFNWEPRIIGDVDNSSKISTGDAKALLKHIAGLEMLPDDEIVYGDINQDGRITTSDAKLLLKYIAKLDGVTLPDTNAVLGITDEETEDEKEIDILLTLILAFQAEKAEEEQKRLEEEARRRAEERQNPTDKPVINPEPQPQTPTEDEEIAKYISEGLDLLKDASKILDELFGSK